MDFKFQQIANIETADKQPDLVTGRHEKCSTTELL